MWQIRRFKSSIFCKLKAKFNMHFKLQKDRARAFLCNGQKLEWVFAKEHLLRHQSLQDLETWISLFIFKFNISNENCSLLKLDLFVSAWGLEKSGQQVNNSNMFGVQTMDSLQIPQMFCPKSRHIIWTKGSFLKVATTRVIHFIKPHLAIIFSSIVFA